MAADLGVVIDAILAAGTQEVVEFKRKGTDVGSDRIGGCFSALSDGWLPPCGLGLPWPCCPWSSFLGHNRFQGFDDPQRSSQRYERKHAAA